MFVGAADLSSVESSPHYSWGTRGWVLPGWNGYLEMQQLARAGLSLEQIFSAARSIMRWEFKLDSQLGTIEPA